MKNGYFEHGENPQYDAKMEREAERKHARYADVERKAALEARIEILKKEIDEAVATEADAKVRAKALRAELKEVEKLLKGSDRTAAVQAQEAARAAGEKTYMTGLPCKNGHYARRYTSSGACTECDRIGWKDGKLKETSYT